MGGLDLRIYWVRADQVLRDLRGQVESRNCSDRAEELAWLKAVQYRNHNRQSCSNPQTNGHFASSHTKNEPGWSLFCTLEWPILFKTLAWGGFKDNRAMLRGLELFWLHWKCKSGRPRSKLKRRSHEKRGWWRRWRIPWESKTSAHHFAFHLTRTTWI